MRTRLFPCLILAAGILLAAKFQIIARYPIPGPVGGWDYVTLDAQARRLYISHATQVEVLDADTGKPVGEILDTPGVHGVAIATKAKRGYTTNGRENKLSIFDSTTLKVLGKVEVGKGPDGIYYDAATDRIFTNNHGSHDSTVVDGTSGKVIGTLALVGDGEQYAPGRGGLIWVTIEDTAEVVAFDPKTLAVKVRHKIASAATPTGLAYDPKTDRLFISCREQPMLIVMDGTSGKEVAKFKIGTGADWAEFDPSSQNIYVSTGEGFLNVFHQKSATEYTEVEAFKTQQSAKTMALDLKSHKLYLPAAQFTVTPPAAGSKKTQRTQNPNSFEVLVVSTN